MDHAKAYAQSIAAAIRHKKAMAAAPKEEIELSPEGAAFDPEEDKGDVPVDPKEARRERLKAILAR